MEGDAEAERGVGFYGDQVVRAFPDRPDSPYSGPRVLYTDNATFFLAGGFSLSLTSVFFSSPFSFVFHPGGCAKENCATFFPTLAASRAEREAPTYIYIGIL